MGLASPCVSEPETSDPTSPSPDPTRHPLELSAETMRELVDQAMARIVDHITSLPEQPVSYTEGGAELARAQVEDLPEQGRPFPELLELIFDELLPRTYNTASPGYLAYIPGGGLFHSAVADLIADAINRYVGVWITAPGLVQLEANVARWFCQMVGYPERAQGLLTTGGSLANLTAIVTARRTRLPDDFSKGTLYCSDQVHHSVTKAAMLAGFPTVNIRRLASDEHFKLRIDELRMRIRADRDAGFSPFLVVGSAGTVNSGAVDDLEGLADLARDEKLWLHIDGAYGGFFILTERGRRRMAGLERADSITLDPPLGLFVPSGTGCLLGRDGAALKRAHHVSADYMPELQHDTGLVDFSEISPELSRGFRGLRVWLPLKLHGVEVFRRALDEKLDLVEWACRELATIEGIEIVAEPQLSILAFRLLQPGLDAEELAQLNRQLCDHINARQRVFLAPTTLDGRYVIRLCVLSFRTHLDRLQQCLEDVRLSVREVLES
jgi:aromatic-L-amino-acid decarboxylase